ncbi:hypothetical protein [Pseudanabaena sp. 'Roaring Creek']|uniref:hypothetical protein n=1 Tax=Pseudanabaena sp. 'Roaring Creek' TaxID=1681830 RepID=UPI0006D787CB|nr:hypothetical protein [Pseudanabaena sp. 'Roaring Creek']
MIEDEFEFKLPKGFVDDCGDLHDRGLMKLLTAKDELTVQKLANANPQIDIVFLLLAQAIAKLGNLNKVIPQQLEQLFLPDFFYLQDLFSELQPQNVNAAGEL